MNIKYSARRLTTALFATVLIGGLCGRARAATAISTCGPLSSAGNYYLTSNLTATGDCLVIAAANVAIDMKGKTITGNGSGAAITDNSIEYNYAIIANGKIRNFDNGIDLADSGEAIISNVDSSNNTGDGIYIDGCCNTLNSVKANNNGGTGIFIDSDDSSLTKIQANSNGNDGIYLASGDNTLVGSTVSNNTGIGVEMLDCCNFVISSKVQKNSGDGIELASDDNGVIKTTSAGNGGDGMDFPTSGDNMVTASKSTGNAGTGVDFASKWGIISGVQANKNATGVSMECRGSTASLTAKGNSTSNLVQTVVDGPCANVGLTAP
ncbi:right-handed parallel beta-helix repeat-containing protein [Candidatus Binatus sp.]|uniref:right-handed parallel beta-helix repeat-containing protein n=1 Tax=Candidatus Binatus sp. TaxID=2811406 RepID=UPI002F939657